MSHVDWTNWLAQCNRELLENLQADFARWDFTTEEIHDELEDLGIRSDALSSQWIGNPGATAEQLTEAERRLGITLPPSYRTFLQISNGWPLPGYTVPRLFSTHEIEWLQQQDPQVVAIWTYDPLPITLSETEYLDYSQHAHEFRAEHLKTALAISEREWAGSAVYLLNPQVITTDGEWEAWLFAHWLPGVIRYPSFHTLIEAERANFLRHRRSS